MMLIRIWGHFSPTDTTTIKSIIHTIVEKKLSISQTEDFIVAAVEIFSKIATSKILSNSDWELLLNHKLYTQLMAIKKKNEMPLASKSIHDFVKELNNYT